MEKPSEEIKPVPLVGLPEDRSARSSSLPEKPPSEKIKVDQFRKTTTRSKKEKV